VTAPDPLIAPFLAAHLDYREVLRQRVSLLEDDELVRVAELFHHTNLRNIPMEFWVVAPRVRVFVRDEQECRARYDALVHKEKE
jgi:hypothetical protein